MFGMGTGVSPSLVSPENSNRQGARFSFQRDALAGLSNSILSPSRRRSGSPRRRVTEGLRAVNDMAKPHGRLVQLG